MNKKIVYLLALILTLSSINVYAADNKKAETSEEFVSSFDRDTVYYPNANLSSAIAKYKKGNYTGCLQELFSLTKKQPSNATAYYYMAMAFTYLDKQDEAINAYEKVISLSPNSYLADYAIKGRDCLTGGPACLPETVNNETQDELDKFINSPYGNGMSEQINKEVKQKQLKNIQETINTKEQLEHQDIQRIRDFDSNKESSIEENEKLAMVSDEEILQAVKTLKEAGLNLTVQSDNPYEQMLQYQDPRMAEMSMLLGNNNNNSNNMMNMIPILMSKAQKGENIDPRIMQTMMMNSMMTDFNFNNNNNRY